MSGIFSLDSKIAIVTGAAGGIGAGIADVLAEAGAMVIVADINADGAQAKAAALRDAGHKAEARALDLADEASVVQVCADIVAAHGAPWVLVNNAGLQDREYLLEASVDEWDRIHRVNARGVFLMTREVGKAMAAAGKGGRIVNIASATLVGMTVKGTSAYVASKGAVAGFTSASALELAEHKITVNAVLPGGVMTPGAISAKGPPTEGPGRRPAIFGMSEPRDIGAAVLFFALPAARYVTNQSLAVDAGFSIS
jgi:NAD(P)-dependent dehydrogenase (short-subunit alcohol dehydrogenase family)